ncbi:alginate export family protein [Aporhodopirellula aestuarii]|uniref:Alginate export family protein n=1 Tax=Aporhodopirellula aestuarii TaxID=2950107 RepID=A0ABT0U9S8_9BACT|nr:alginate export family protein [Aporhodopirellula aestuarii]MCM2373148.1 alginate export family protein [Aporhodopirellula aestuarii]
MVSSTSRRRRMIFAALSSMAFVGFSTNAIQAQEISENGLQTVILQTAGVEDAPVVDAPVEQAVAEPVPMAESYYVEQPMPTYDSQPACNCYAAGGAKKQEAATAKMKAAYAGVFYANNFSYLNDPYYNGPTYFSDNFKNLSTPFGRLDLGGETRYRYHNERNHRGVGITGRDDNFWLSRTRLYADWDVCDDIRVYGEILNAESMGETFAPRPIEEQDADILNLFVDVKLYDGDHGKLITRVGRQELLFGAQRTVSPLDWANTRRTFEGIRGIYQNGDTSIDAFWTGYVPVQPDDADEADYDIQFYGAYATRKNTVLGNVDAYWLGSDDRNVGYSYQTTGSRISGKTNGGMLYEFEGAYQFGENETPDDHSAGFITAGLGRKIETKHLSPTVWLYYDWASGEEDFNEVGRADGGYDHLYPLAHKYNGFMDLFGRRNLHDFNVLSVTPLHKKVSLILWYHYFRLDQATTPYSVVMTPYNTTTAAASKDLGSEIDVLFNINLNPRNNVLFGYSHFAGGDYYKTTTPPTMLNGDFDADFFYFQYTTRY